jgi:hypothetical protein
LTKPLPIKEFFEMNGLFEVEIKHLNAEIAEYEQLLAQRKADLEAIVSLETRTVEALVSLQETIARLRQSGASTDYLRDTVEALFATKDTTPELEDVSESPTETSRKPTTRTTPEREEPPEESSVTRDSHAPDGNNQLNGVEPKKQHTAKVFPADEFEVGTRVIIRSPNYQNKYFGQEAVVREVNRYGVKVELGDDELKFFLKDQLELLPLSFKRPVLPQAGIAG